ncbi:aldehyde-activating protein [Notoacmeibacter marinus]|uniref:Aldehyde-activating protein n=2 Tax=Notoacmeibacter marinus TaxID=1876515 RepID=A0A231V0S0_9HYPH|nr:GFA family protein [Notoacmeibacter marinus]OXT01788.1 aldehyde-activating protein [Notoacmeibacter marinus]
MTMTTDWKLPWKAHCRCGAVEMTISAQPLLTMACHCRGCQKMSASAYSCSMAVPTDGFAVDGPARDTREAEGEGGYTHNFCPKCHSWIFTEFPPEMGFVNLRATMLDDPSWFAPFVETQTAEKLPFAETGAPHSFERFPQMEEMMQLVQRYAAEGAKPA